MKFIYLYFLMYGIYAWKIFSERHTQKGKKNYSSSELFFFSSSSFDGAHKTGKIKNVRGESEWVSEREKEKNHIWISKICRSTHETKQHRENPQLSTERIKKKYYKQHRKQE